MNIKMVEELLRASISCDQIVSSLLLVALVIELLNIKYQLCNYGRYDETKWSFHKIEFLKFAARTAGPSARISIEIRNTRI